MQKKINGHHVEITAQLKEYTDKKLAKLESYADLISHTQITFSQEKLKNIAQGQLHVPGNTIIAKAEGESHTAAMDSLIDKLLLLIKKHKDKVGEHR